MTFVKNKIIKSLLLCFLFRICELTAGIELIKFLIVFNVMFEAEMHITREAGSFHYGWFCNLAFDFNKSGESVKKSAFFIPEYSSAVLSATEIGEIRNQINYMLEAEDDADEEFSSDFSDPFVVDTGDPFVVGADPFEVDYGDPFVVSDE